MEYIIKHKHYTLWISKKDKDTWILSKTNPITFRSYTSADELLKEIGEDCLEVVGNIDIEKLK